MIRKKIGVNRFIIYLLLLMLAYLLTPALVNAAVGWENVDGQMKYRTVSGYVTNTVKEIDGKVYAFDKNGFLKKGWVTWKKNKYYFYQDSGEAAVGQNMIGNNSYVFNDKGILQKGFFMYDGRLYYAQKNGKLICGKTFKVKKKSYYAFQDGHLMRNGWCEGNYYNSQGQAAQETFLYDPGLNSKLTPSALQEAGADHCDKLMIVAHPDDETLWGGAHLSKGGYFVLCLTNGDYALRSSEFSTVMKASRNYGLILDYPDYANVTTRTKSEWVMAKAMIAKDIDTVLGYKNWKLVVTHNPDGEYGHKHHRFTNQIVSQSFYSGSGRSFELWYFGKYYGKSALKKVQKTLPKSSSKALKLKKKYLSLYSNENSTIKAHSHMNAYEDWVRAEDWWK